MIRPVDTPLWLDDADKLHIGPELQHGDQSLTAMNRNNLRFPPFDMCALCGQSRKLQRSHIIPAFVFRWLRETSATGHMRFSGAPNVRAQDGWKLKILCADCERQFSLWEKKFAETCFNPILGRHVEKARYQRWMLKFATSVSWRVLSTFKAIGGLKGFPTHLDSAVDVALTAWADFLLDRRPHPGRHEQHLILFGAIQSTSVVGVPPNINRYLLRAIEVYVAHSSDGAFTYAKLGPFMLFGFIEMDYPRRWKGTKIRANCGDLPTGDFELPKNVGEFIFDRAQLMAKRQRGISDHQRDQIAKTYGRNVGRAATSESMRAMHYDVSLFGEEAFRISKPRRS